MKTFFRNTFILLFALCFQVGKAQSGSIVLSTEKTLPAKNNELITLIISIENKSDLEGDFQLEASAGRYLSILKQSSSISLGAREKQFLSFKVYVTRDQPAGGSPIEFKLFDSEKRIVASSVTNLKIESKKGLRITTSTPQEVIYQVGDSLKVSAQVHNSGNQKENVKIVASFPSLSGTPLNIEKLVSVDPFTSKTVSISKIIDKDLLQQELFNVNISLLTPSNEFIGNTMVLVQNALGNRRYTDPNQQRMLSSYGIGNQVSWSIRNPFSKVDASQNLNLYAKGTAANLEAELSVNALYYHNQDLPTLFQNTYFGLEKRGIGGRIGNLYATDLDISLVGRGAEFFVKPVGGRKLGLRVGAIEKSYNLFDPLDFQNSARGYSTFISSNYKLNGYADVEADLVYDRDGFSDNVLASTAYDYHGLNSRYRISLGYGITQDLEDSSRKEGSYAVGLNFQTTWKDFTVSSDNYLSSAYYPGLRKGTTLFTQRITRSFGKITTWAGYSLSFYQPKNISPLFNYSTNTKRHRADLGAIMRLGKQWSLSLAPEYQSESSNLLIYGESAAKLLPVHFQLAHLNSTLNYTTPSNKHRFTLNYAQGLGRFVSYTPLQMVYRGQFTYNFSNLLFSASAQKGSFLLYEGARNGTVSNEVEKYTGLVSYNKTFFANKLTVNLSAVGSKDTFLGTNASISSNFEWSVGKSTKIFGYYTYTKYFSNQYSFANGYFQIGLTQNLPRLGDPAVDYKNGSIEVFAFHDLNNNQSYEEGIDELASGHKISINKTLFIADKDGEVRYRRLPYGSYEIKSLDPSWYYRDAIVEVNSKQTRLLMPLEKTGRIEGKLKYSDFNKNQYEISSSLAGITVRFTDDFGRTFTSYTDQGGRYIAFLPLGHYTVLVDSESLQQNVYVEGETIHAEAKLNETYKIPEITLKIRERKVEVMRFGE